MGSLDRKEIFKNMPNDIKKIVMLLAHGVGGRWGGVYLNKYPTFFYRKKKWMRDYIIFSHLSHKLRLELKVIFEKIGYWKNGKKKKEFRIFEYIWKHPFYYSYEIAKKFKVGDVHVKLIKKRYLDKIKECSNNEDMWMLLYYFDRCVFKPQGRLKKTSAVVKRKAKERV